MRRIFALLAAVVFSSSAMAVSLEEDVASYIKIFSGDDRSAQSAAALTLQWTGLSDTRLFDIIEKHIVADYAPAGLERADVVRLERLVRALGYSGQTKYAATLKKYDEDINYKDEVKVALADMPVYQKWNVIISNRSTFDPKYSDSANRVMNMLRADDLLLNEMGAKRIFYEVKEDYIYDYLATQVKANYLKTTPEQSDAHAWQVKALCSSKKEKYRALILQVEDKAVDATVVRYARIGIEKYYTTY